MTVTNQQKYNLTVHWAILYLMLLMLVSYHVICHFFGSELRINLSEEQRVFTRSIFYVISIILFPVTNLIRHIMLRLNQTMPGKTPAKQRYLVTTIITLSCIEIVGLFGFIMFMLGDEINSLYIFTVLGLLGLFLHRPRQSELQQIIEALGK